MNYDQKIEFIVEKIYQNSESKDWEIGKNYIYNFLEDIEKEVLFLEWTEEDKNQHKNRIFTLTTLKESISKVDHLIENKSLLEKNLSKNNPEDFYEYTKKLVAQQLNHLIHKSTVFYWKIRFVKACRFLLNSEIYDTPRFIEHSTNQPSDFEVIFKTKESANKIKEKVEKEYKNIKMKPPLMVLIPHNSFGEVIKLTQ